MIKEEYRFNNIKVRRVKAEEAIRIFDFLRYEDVEEIEALGQEHTKERLLKSYKQVKHLYLVEEKYNPELGVMPVAVFGITPMEHDKRIGVVFLQGGYNFKKHIKDINFGMHGFFYKWGLTYKTFFNLIYEGNKVHKNWVKRVGFDIESDKIIMETGKKFQKIYRRNV